MTKYSVNCYSHFNPVEQHERQRCGQDVNRCSSPEGPVRVPLSAESQGQTFWNEKKYSVIHIEHLLTDANGCGQHYTKVSKPWRRKPKVRLKGRRVQRRFRTVLLLLMLKQFWLYISYIKHLWILEFWFDKSHNRKTSSWVKGANKQWWAFSVFGCCQSLLRTFYAFDKVPIAKTQQETGKEI